MTRLKTRPVKIGHEMHKGNLRLLAERRAASKRARAARKIQRRNRK